MTIVFVGWASFDALQRQLPFAPPLPKVEWGFPLGATIVLGLVKRGHHVHVIVTDHKFDGHKVYKADGSTIHVLPERTTRRMFLTFFHQETAAMAELIRSLGPDVVFAQWPYQNARAAIKSGRPFLTVAHDSPWRVLWLFRNVQSLIKAIYAQLFVFPRLKHVTAVSPHIVDDLHRLNRFKGEIPVIPNGIEIGKRKEELGNRVIRKAANTIVCVSQWGRLKNVKTLVKAFGILRQKHPDWRLIVYGQGLEPVVSGKGLGVSGHEGGERVKRGKWKGLCLSGVELRGLASREEIDRVLREEADVFCSPTLEESFGMVFVEAMLQGVPCVGGERSGAVPWVLGVGEEIGNREKEIGNRMCGEARSTSSSFLIPNSDNANAGGLVCDVTNPKKLADCLERVMLDYELRKRLSENGRKRVIENFNIEHVVDLYEKELMHVARVGGIDESGK